MLVEHPRIYLDATGETTDALLIRDGRIRAVGGDARHGADRSDDHLRPDGACLLPALGDAHVHLWGLGLRAGTVDLRGLDVDEVLDALEAAEPAEAGWIFGTNLDDHRFSSGRRLTRDHLDRLFPNTPVCIHRVDRHALWVNTEALDRADWSSPSWPGPDGRVECDAEGRPTGVLVDDAKEPVIEAIPEPNLEERRDVFFESADRLRDHGIAFCTIAWCRRPELEMLRRLAADDELPLSLDVLVDGADETTDDIIDNGPFAEGDLRVGGVKFFADGALGSRGAHLLSTYRHGGDGVAIHPDGFFADRIPKLMNRGWQIAVHAIGDAANRRILDALESVSAPLRSRLRPRIEHAQIVADDDCRRFDALDVIASIQPIHLRSDVCWASEHLDDNQLDRLFPWRRLAPATFAAGSDYPIEDPNPWHGIATALARRGADGRRFRPDQALRRGEIIGAYTRGAAFASHREDDFGTLRPGFRAAVTVADTDPFDASPEKIWETDAGLLGD